MSKHTPGPWKAVAQAGGHETADFSVVASKQPQGPGQPDSVIVVADVFDSYANARLIAEAPAMATALQQILKMTNWQGESLDQSQVNTVNDIARRALGGDS